MELISLYFLMAITQCVLSVVIINIFLYFIDNKFNLRKLFNDRFDLKLLAIISFLALYFFIGQKVIDPDIRFGIIFGAFYFLFFSKKMLR